MQVDKAEAREADGAGSGQPDPRAVVNLEVLGQLLLGKLLEVHAGAVWVGGQGQPPQSVQHRLNLGQFINGNGIIMPEKYSCPEPGSMKELPTGSSGF